jgi:hypothetical protein
MRERTEYRSQKSEFRIYDSIVLLLTPEYWLLDTSNQGPQEGISL